MLRDKLMALRSLLLNLANGRGILGVDRDRLRAERTADADLLASLQGQGDCPVIARQIDLRFVGPKAGIAELASASAALGFEIVHSVEVSDKVGAIDLSVGLDTLPSSIDALTVSALQIERRFGLRYDGWGTMARRC